MTFEEIVTQAKSLPISQRKELIFNLVESIATSGNKPIAERVFGLTKGTFVMSDDFDEELPDAFWLGDEA